VFGLVESFKLEQSDTAPIVRFSGLAVARDGRIALGDWSEKHVKIFSPNGRLLAVLGRKGTAPGEFLLPRNPRFDASGRLHVADGVQPRVQVFGPSGELERTVDLEGVSNVVGFQLLPAGSYLIADIGSEKLLHRFDSTGRVVASYFPWSRSKPPVAQDPGAPIWQSVLFYDVAVRHDTAFVVSTLSDSLWLVSLQSGDISSSRLRFEGYIPPHPPEGGRVSIAQVSNWRKGFHMPSYVAANTSVVMVPFTMGILVEGDPYVLVMQDRKGRWIAIDDAPPILYVGDAYVLALMNSKDSGDSVVLSRYEYR
jgi:hypothetical protein